MLWRIGIDEAGYGPNLGPLVMTSVACRVPDEHADADLWSVLRTALVRQARADGERMVVDDSKEVYSTARGLGDLESAVLGFLTGAGKFRAKLDLGEFLTHLTSNHDLHDECWYTGLSPVPSISLEELISHHGARLAEACARKTVVWGTVRCHVVCASRFNGLVERWGSKGAVLAVGFAELMQANLREHSGPLRIVVDKHGGRNFYGPMIQEAVPGGFVLPRRESADESTYDVDGLEQPVRITFRPRADGAELCVALASMISKYVREALMHEFNHFWQGHVPGLKPTAGYPGDASRFYNAILPTLKHLGLEARTVWRER